MPLVPLAAVLLALPVCAQSQQEVEAKIAAIHAQMKAVRDSSPFRGQENARQKLEEVVADPSRCAGAASDPYCKVYSEVLKDRPGLKTQDVFAAFDADQALKYGLLQSVTGCTGDSRVFAQLARKAGLTFKRFGSSVRADYIRECYENGRKRGEVRPSAHLNGHAGVVVAWGGKWRMLDSSDYDEAKYAKDKEGRVVALDRAEDFVGREVWFGFEGFDPYIVTNVDDDLDTNYTSDQIRGVGASGKPGEKACAFDADPDAVRDQSDCPFKGVTAFDDGKSLDFGCGRCYVHRSRETGFLPRQGERCQLTTHPQNGRGDMRDCACVRCGADRHEFYPGGCGPAR